MTVIALSGWKGSGKDTVASYLVKEYGFTQLSFAAKLKDLVASTYGVPREDLDNPTKKEMPLVTYPAIPTDPFSEAVHIMLKDELKSGFWTPRALCILEGSIKRAVHPNFWVKTVVEEIINNQYQDKFVISDMRYQSEADILKLLLNNKNLHTVRVERYDTITTNDPSERNLDAYKFDFLLFNQSTKEDLYEQVDHIMYGHGVLDSNSGF